MFGDFVSGSQLYHGDCAWELEVLMALPRTSFLFIRLLPDTVVSSMACICLF